MKVASRASTIVREFIYIKPPKTASTTIRFAFEPWVGHTRGMYFKDQNVMDSIPYGHLRAREIIENIGIKKFTNVTTFITIRNPWARYLSYFLFTECRVEWLLNTKVTSYKEAFRKFTLGSQHWPSLPPMYSYVIDNNNNPVVDTYIRVESLQEDFNKVCKTIGIVPCILKQRRKYNKRHKLPELYKHYTEFYDDETRDSVSRRYSKDIDYFGYKFGE